MSTSWQDILREQQEELRRLEQMNEALDADQGALDADINRALKPRSAASTAAAARARSGAGGSAASHSRTSLGRTRISSRGSGSFATAGADEEADHVSDAADEMEALNLDMPLKARPGNDAPPALPPSPEVDGSKAPEVALRWVYRSHFSSSVMPDLLLVSQVSES
jgi:hypothetical protein